MIGHFRLRRPRQAQADPFLQRGDLRRGQLVALLRHCLDTSGMIDRLDQLAGARIARLDDLAVITAAHDGGTGVEAQAVLMLVRAVALVAALREHRADVFLKELDLLRRKRVRRRGERAGDGKAAQNKSRETGNAGSCGGFGARQFSAELQKTKRASIGPPCRRDWALHPQGQKPASTKATADLLAQVRAQPDVLAASSYLRGVMYAEREGMQSGMDVIGLPADGAKFYMAKIAPHRLEGSLELRHGGVVCADYIAGQLDAHPGDKISVYASTNVTSAVQRFRIASDEQDEAKRHAAYKNIKLHARELILQGYTRSETAGAYGYTTLETAQQVCRYHVGGVTEADR
jgi:hypothetical protein